MSKTVEDILADMLTENTGAAMCDSGDVYGRNWERNKGKTKEDFENEKEVVLVFDGNIVETDYYIISIYHYLKSQLDVDEICNGFNALNEDAENWDDDRFYGVSTEAGRYLDKYHAKINVTFNSYNGETALNHVMQGTYVEIADNSYVILQIHGGCDVRGGYTNARLFLITNEWEGFLGPEDVGGVYTPNDVDFETNMLFNESQEAVNGVIYFGNSYDGHSLRKDDTDEPVRLDISKGKIAVWLMSGY